MDINNINTSGAYRDYSSNEYKAGEQPIRDLPRLDDDMKKRLEELKSEMDARAEELREKMTGTKRPPISPDRPLEPRLSYDDIEKLKNEMREKIEKMRQELERGFPPNTVPIDRSWNIPPEILQQMAGSYNDVANIQGNEISRYLDSIKDMPGPLSDAIKAGFDARMHSFSHSLQSLKNLQQQLKPLEPLMAKDASIKANYDQINQNIEKLEAERAQLQERAKSIGLEPASGTGLKPDKKIGNDLENPDEAAKVSSRGLKRMRNMQSGIRI